MNLDNALLIHARWKEKLRQAIAHQEPIDHAALLRDDLCEVGKWIHGEAKALFGKTAVFRQLEHRHALFHSAAGRVAEAISAGDFELASKRLNGKDFAYASTQVGIAIVQTKKTVGRADHG